MRASASAPARHLRLRSILGWYHISHQPLASASSISIRGRASEVMESTKERRSSSPSFSIGPDQRRASGGGLWGAIGDVSRLSGAILSTRLLTIGFGRQTFGEFLPTRSGA